ncbi:MAG: tRNA threonylcarbamoyladenosine dehydratase [Ottowia sp.]|nr:tRNA threonylcarbamoyladenosine dehydratase [Ottowia sp.]
MDNDRPPLKATEEGQRRFSGVARLYGEIGLARLRTAHVCVIGLGGVGSWAVEALARNAIGTFTLIDLDNVSASNTNRQIHALDENYGLAKVTAMARRITAINPEAQVSAIEDFIDENNLDALIPINCTAIIDAIDMVANKTALIAWAVSHQLKLITCGAAGGKFNPLQTRIADLSRTEQDPLLAKVRSNLRRNHGFPRGEKTKFGITAIYSAEPVSLPQTESCPSIPLTGLNCAGYGSSVNVTATFGFTAAAQVLQHIVLDTL